MTTFCVCELFHNFKKEKKNAVRLNFEESNDLQVHYYVYEIENKQVFVFFFSSQAHFVEQATSKERFETVMISYRNF